jgi:hypothetical protein
MNYELLIFLSIVVVLTTLFLLSRDYFNKLGYTDEQINNTLDTTKLVSIFIKSILKDKERYKDNIEMYSVLLSEAIEYIKILSFDIPRDEKIKYGINSLVNVAENLDIQLNDDEIIMLHGVLVLVYDFYLQLNKNKVK